MHFRSIVKLASAGLALMGSFSCAGSMDNGESDVGGIHAELIAKKREWLKGYHDDCQVCFNAFEQCGRGAVSDAETEACQVALDACVRGGLIDEEDGGVDASDGGLPPPADDDGADDGDGADDSGDAGIDVEDDAGIADDDDNDDTDQSKGELIEDIGVCLDNVRSCMSVPNADKRACIDALKGCVKAAVSGAFEGVCASEIKECIEERVSSATLERVRELCEEAVVP